MEFSRQEYWSGYHSLLQKSFLTQGSNPGFPPCRHILYFLGHQGGWNPVRALVVSDNKVPSGIRQGRFRDSILSSKSRPDHFCPEMLIFFLCLSTVMWPLSLSLLGIRMVTAVPIMTCRDGKTGSKASCP